MFAAMFANGGLKKFRLQHAGEPERLGFILYFLGQLREFQAQQKTVYCRQCVRLQRGHFGHHVGQEQGRSRAGSLVLINSFYGIGR